tara:strand:- start:372 stop:602 length:231 start_codon:yes stop_codon:yes gene_type:complete
MNKKTLIQVGVLVLLAGGIYYYMNKKKEENGSSKIKPKPPVISTSKIQKDCEAKFLNTKMSAEAKKSAIDNCVSGK